MLKKVESDIASTKYFEVLRNNVKYQLLYNLETQHILSRLLEQGSQLSYYFANGNVSAYKYDLRTEKKMKTKIRKFIYLCKYINIRFIYIYRYIYIYNIYIYI